MVLLACKMAPEKIKKIIIHNLIIARFDNTLMEQHVFMANQISKVPDKIKHGKL